MTDPKFNELPIDAEGDFEQTESATGQPVRRPTKPREGLSINDTIAASANLSVGSRGVDTSGVTTGSGAGAGMSFTTPEDDGSPAPNVVPGAGGSGTTVRADKVSGQIPTTRVEAGAETASTSSVGNSGLSNPGLTYAGFTSDEVSARAYRCWMERGRPHGSPEVDWQTAVEQLREEREGTRTHIATV